jgi:tRNA pseudouridine55 synthase
MKLFGLLNVNKPSGVTSRRVVDQIERLVKPAKVGHAGTLDPLARGVLVIGVGQATRLVEYVQQMPKQYQATFLLGRSSTTEDIEGDVTLLPDAPPPSLNQLERAAVELTGEIQQRPPAFSALKVAGRRAYTLARAGQSVELAARQIQIHRLQIVCYEYPELRLDVECSSGTYIRSLGRDLAERVGTAAVMSALVRTAIGNFRIETAVDPGKLSGENVREYLLPPVLAVRGLMSERVVSDEDAGRLVNGLPIGLVEASGEHCAALDARGRLMAILTRRADELFAPAKNFPIG